MTIIAVEEPTLGRSKKNDGPAQEKATMGLLPDKWQRELHLRGIWSSNYASILRAKKVTYAMYTFCH